MVEAIDVTNQAISQRVVQIQRSAYAVEAKLIGFDGIPQLHETASDVMRRTDLEWLGAVAQGVLVGVIAWSTADGTIDIDRLAVDPAHARSGHGIALVAAIPAEATITVSTGVLNRPARNLYERLGFRCVGESEIAPQVLIAHYARAPT